MNLVRLNSSHDVMSFGCQNSNLTAFLQEDAYNFQRNLLGVTYLVVVDGKIAAYTTLLNDKIGTEEKIGKETKTTKLKAFRRRLPQAKRLRSYPAAKIGRLAVASEFVGTGIGAALVEYLVGWFVTNNKTGCRYLTVDSVQEATTFYEKLGFHFLVSADAEDDTRIMFLDLLPFVDSL